MPTELRDRVIPGLCRQALEAACVAKVRRDRLVRGEAHLDIERLIDENDSLMHRLSLALFDSADRGGGVMNCLNKSSRRHGDVVKLCNKGAHGDATSVDRKFINDVEALARKIQTS